MLNQIPKSFDRMESMFGEGSTKAKEKYIRTVSSIRFILDLAAKSGPPPGCYYRTYPPPWKFLAFQLVSRLPFTYPFIKFVGSKVNSIGRKIVNDWDEPCEIKSPR